MSNVSTVTSRRVPPPCWTKDETVALINAYSSRWMSLNRGNLRACDWDDVSSAVSDSNLGAPKSSLQCRHKIEKLRQRYRSEKQRSVACPGWFKSSWDLFPLLDSFDFGSSSVMGFKDHVSSQQIMEVNKLHPEVVNGKSWPSKNRKTDGDVNQDFDSNRIFRGGFQKKYGNINDFGLKLRDDGSLVDLETRANNGFLKTNGDSMANFGFDHVLGDGFSVKKQERGDRNFMSPGVRLKDYGEIHVKKSSSIPHFNYNPDGYPMEMVADEISAHPTGFKSKNHQKHYGNLNSNPYYHVTPDYDVGNGNNRDGFNAKTFGDRDFLPFGNGLNKEYNRVDVNPVGDSSSRLKFGKKNGVSGVKRGLDEVGELVSSFTNLIERFVKVEKMKIEMARETEQMRMEMEIKHNQMMLETQQQVLESFVKEFLGKKKSKKVKVKVEVVSPSTGSKCSR